MKYIGFPVVLSILALLCPPAATPAYADAAVAVGVIADDGVNPMFNAANFDPGKAFGDILTDKLVNIGKLSMVDRAHIDAVFAEQKNTQSGDFVANNAVQLGHMVGANYMIVGRIVHLDKVTSNTAAIGSVFGGLGGISNSGVSQDRYHLQISLQVIDTSTGRIIKALNYDDTRTAHGVTIGDTTTGAGYSSTTFASSIVGQLLNAAGDDMAKKLSVIDLTAAAAPTVSALMIAADGTNVILNKGSADGVTVGMFFNTYHQVTATDPSTGKTLVTNVPDGQLEITSVSANSSVAKVVSGKPVVPGGMASN